MSTVDPQDARDAADEILARPEFRERPQALVDRALSWLARRLGDVFSLVFGGSSGLLFGYTLLAVAAIAAIYFLWRFLPRGRGTRSATRVEIGTEIIVRRSRADWLAEAATAAADNRWADALNARYHALTTGLADAEELSPAPSTTSGEHRRRFADVAAGAPTRRDRFDETVGRYEEVWFGEASAAAADVAAAAAADDDVMPPA